MVNKWLVDCRLGGQWVVSLRSIDWSVYGQLVISALRLTRGAAVVVIV